MVVSKAPIVDASTTLLDVGPSTTDSPIDGPMTLLRSESLAWNMFKQVVKDKDVTICYDMFVREFERSTIYDLFKVYMFSFFFLFLFLAVNKVASY